MTVYAITDTKKGEQGLRLLIFKLGPEQPERLLVTPLMSYFVTVLIVVIVIFIHHK